LRSRLPVVDRLPSRAPRSGVQAVAERRANEPGTFATGIPQERHLVSVRLVSPDQLRSPAECLNDPLGQHDHWWERQAQVLSARPDVSDCHGDCHADWKRSVSCSWSTPRWAAV